MNSPVILQKVVFPSVSEPDVVPLYVDADSWSDIREEIAPDPKAVKHRRGVIPNEVHLTPIRLSQVNAANMLRGRRGMSLPNASRVSLGTYFNAFPTSYWRRWTTLTGVRLNITTRGAGDVIVYRSNARGVVQTVSSAHLNADGVTDFDLDFVNFLDGGWYWFDLISRDDNFELVEANWLAPEGADAPVHDSKLTISITTLNRTEYCVKLLGTIASDPDTVRGIDRILVVDQGSDKLKEADGFEEVSAALDGRLDLIEQKNVGGSGGFSRGMIETVTAGTSDFVMLLDDDVMVEPECIRRAQVFAEFCEHPTIVGGHMFDMYDTTKLHAFAEGVDRWTFNWGALTPDRHDFTSSNLRQTKWMHQRIDVDYNGWWMSLIPVKVIREVGLSLPVFIKWDDAEYSLRASLHGYSTVSLPGVAVWHVSWVDKDDSKDWQAFFHARNRLIAALLHSPHKRGGRLPISNLATDLRHLLTMDYYAVTLRQLAYDSVLAGPAFLHEEMETRLPQVRSLASDFTEPQLLRTLSQFDRIPATEYTGENVGRSGMRGAALYKLLLRQVPRHWFAKPHPGASTQPDHHLPSVTPWWSIAHHDSFIISNAEGSGVSWHVRDRARFRSLLWSSLTRNLRYRRRWSSLSGQYRQALPEITAMETWQQSLGLLDSVKEPIKGRP